ncbi:hypothetical protein WJX84_003392 [Apatococcus fuscideae]|uniref:Uncharacterized protein n=1 Tax=Apatococcus fuscideae TaxID=2026836 RepID=A0AAW1T3I0_9CHLO
MPKPHIEETKSGEASCARCVSIYWSVQKLLSAPHPPPVHHIYSEITETERCDDFMREFPQIRKDLFNRLGKYDLEPGILERIKSLRVNDYDKEVLEQNYHHYRWWLIRLTEQELRQREGFFNFYWQKSQGTMILALAIGAERVADYSWRYWGARAAVTEQKFERPSDNDTV